LEMQGWAVHRLVWVGSVGYFLANVQFLRTILFHCHPTPLLQARATIMMIDTSNKEEKQN
jgi:hypothetical protein